MNRQIAFVKYNSSFVDQYAENAKPYVLGHNLRHTA